MAKRRSLHAKIRRLLGGYAVLLAAIIILVFADDFLEDWVWKLLLQQEIVHYVQQKAADPGHEWRDTDAIQLYRVPGRQPPPGLSMLPQGVHDDFWFGGRENVVLVQRVQGVDYFVVRDITGIETIEDALLLGSLGLAFIALVVIGVMVARGVRTALRPLSDLANDIGALSPDHAGQRVVVADGASSELHVITNALNDYLRRQDDFVERERTFIDTASHELRTPIAIMAGASELALEQPGLPAPARQQVQRIHRTARDVERLIALLLTLAKDPARLSRSNEVVMLHELLPDIIDDHRHLLAGKDLSIVVDELLPCTVSAPLHIVQAAIGNLLRNAIENSDRGEIHIRLDADATVTLQDPGHGMSPEDISRIYAQLARGGSREGGGIGLDLLARLCEHLGWTLSIQSAPGRGTISRLRLSR
ncbi:HAMP domain-containing histidine kinase [Pseudoxanthomonas sp. PXM03]|jgi:Signal transduction histidine kinase|uniref:sensor histidine kinase n=1 Tax=Pseudoxanthomonas sp. PXM03 TaxID=2769284 RepID=UPI00177ED847|nr:HAMP domain-containing sensor histidine kinase [Pseudoxanthomonas sp. PXM03]MBD9434599.1 HAMP domain-containing histidine kinase [Pseudoxanthomonas sp. PXM03]